MKRYSEILRLTVEVKAAEKQIAYYQNQNDDFMRGYFSGQRDLRKGELMSEIKIATIEARKHVDAAIDYLRDNDFEFDVRFDSEHDMATRWMDDMKLNGDDPIASLDIAARAIVQAAEIIDEAARDEAIDKAEQDARWAESRRPA